MLTISSNERLFQNYQSADQDDIQRFYLVLCVRYKKIHVYTKTTFYTVGATSGRPPFTTFYTVGATSGRPPLTKKAPPRWGKFIIAVWIPIPSNENRLAFRFLRYRIPECHPTKANLLQD